MSKDFQNGFALGLASGGVVEVADTTEMDALENLIDESGVLDSTERTVSEKVGQLIDKAAWENVWYEVSENIQNANYLFRNYQGVTIPRTNLINATSFGRFIQNSNVEYIDYYIDTQKVTSFQYGFAYAASLKRIKGVNTSKASQINGIFMDDNLLETIEEPLDFSSVTQNMGLAFGGCHALKNIKFVAGSINLSVNITSANLTDESIQSIIDGLVTVETAQTLNLNSAIALTEEQKATINAKGWTLAQ